MIECKNVIKEFGEPPQRVLHGLSFKIEDGEFVSISGRSGSGKSTLLYLISSLDTPSSGEIFIDGKNLNNINSDQIHAFRNQNVGFIFQFHYLLPELTSIENVLLPARNLGIMNERSEFAKSLLKELGVLEKMNRYPSELSGGEQQRIAIARALVLKPRYIFADEPTGNLDTINARIVMNMLKKVNQENKTTICLVTHDPSFAAMGDREIYLVDGRISSRDRDTIS
ncbi:MAG: ABC transporter ATP-binding protein [Bacteriovoracaceae bacterium]